MEIGRKTNTSCNESGNGGRREGWGSVDAKEAQTEPHQQQTVAAARRSVRTILNSDRHCAISRRIHSHQSPVVFRHDERAGGCSRFDYYWSRADVARKRASKKSGSTGLSASSIDKRKSFRNKERLASIPQ